MKTPALFRAGVLPNKLLSLNQPFDQDYTPTISGPSESLRDVLKKHQHRRSYFFGASPRAANCVAMALFTTTCRGRDGATPSPEEAPTPPSSSSSSS